MLKLIYIFGHVLILNSRCYGRCYVKKKKTYTTRYGTRLEENSVRSFQNVFDKSLRVLILLFLRNWNSPYFWVLYPLSLLSLLWSELYLRRCFGLRDKSLGSSRKITLSQVLRLSQYNSSFVSVNTLAMFQYCPKFLHEMFLKCDHGCVIIFTSNVVLHSNSHGWHF